MTHGAVGVVLQERGVIELERLSTVRHDKLPQVRQRLHALLHFLHGVKLGLRFVVGLDSSDLWSCPNDELPQIRQQLHALLHFLYGVRARVTVRAGFRVEVGFD